MTRTPSSACAAYSSTTLRPSPRPSTADTDDVGGSDTDTRNGKPSPVATSNELELELKGLESTNRRSSMDESLRLKLHSGFKPDDDDDGDGSWRVSYIFTTPVVLPVATR